MRRWIIPFLAYSAAMFLAEAPAFARLPEAYAMVRQAPAYHDAQDALAARLQPIFAEVLRRVR